MALLTRRVFATAAAGVLLASRALSPTFGFLYPASGQCPACWRQPWAGGGVSTSTGSVRPEMKAVSEAGDSKEGTKKGTPAKSPQARVAKQASSVQNPLGEITSKVAKVGKGIEAAKVAVMDTDEYINERQTARWGVAPPSTNPFEGVASGISKVGQGISAAKDALYGVADTVDDLSSSVKPSAAALSIGNANPGTSDRDVGEGNSPNPLQIAGSGLNLLVKGATTLKDAFWGSLDLVDVAFEKARDLPVATRTAVEGAKEGADAIARAPATVAAAVTEALDLVAGAADGVGKAVVAVKDGAYGVVDSLAGLPSMLAEQEERRKQEEEERERAAALEEAGRKEAVRKLRGAVGDVKDALWGTVDTVDTVVEAVAAAPETAKRGVLQAKEAGMEAQAAAQELVAKAQELPAAVQRVPQEVQRRVEGTQAALRDSQTLTVSLARRAAEAATAVTELATGIRARKQEERRRAEEEERRKKKMAEAVVVIGGEPYTAKDIAGVSLKVLGATVKGLASAAYQTPGAVVAAVQAPEKALRNTLQPIYDYQQSQARIKEAILAEPAVDNTTSPPTPLAPEAEPTPLPGAEGDGSRDPVTAAGRAGTARGGEVSEQLSGIGAGAVRGRVGKEVKDRRRQGWAKGKVRGGEVEE